jgi:iron only hydrogenase large subunit-like protein
MYPIINQEGIFLLLEKIKEGAKYHLIELMTCYGGCIGGV